MDKNTLAGFGLLLLLLVGYIVYNQQAEAKFQATRTKDSIENARLHPVAIKQVDTSKPVVASVADTSLISSGVPEQISVIENGDISISFTNHGAFAKKAQLQKFKTFDGKPLMLFDGSKNTMDYGFKSVAGSMVHSKDLVFTPTISADKKSISFACPDMTMTYTLPDKGYMLAMSVLPTTADKSQTISLDWKSESLLTEQDITSQKQYTQVCYNLAGEGFDKFTIDKKQDKDLKQSIKWLSFKQHYFNTTLIPDQAFVLSGKISAAPSAEDTAKHTLSDFNASLVMQSQDKLSFRFFLGPNDYRLLKTYKTDLEELIPLSYGIFGFVKYINIWLILPIFYGLSKFMSSFGLVILFLTFIIRLLMSPFTYKSYVSSAKMKALKPELDELKEKLGDDKQAYGVEQMKLYRQAGVNPLGGCLPALLQLPVFFALLSFFPQSIELRQEKFLWAKDLSTYDSIYDLPFTIPFYGNHISLFTIGFVVTSLLLALYSMNMATTDQNNPMMKYMPFIMPVMFLGIFNKLPASLTFYYFVSNAITLGLQFVIQKWIIDPDKIHAQIQAKKNEPAKENKLMKRMAEMQAQNQAKLKAGKK